LSYGRSKEDIFNKFLHVLQGKNSKK